MKRLIRWLINRPRGLQAEVRHESSTRRRWKRIALAFLMPLVLATSDLAARYWLATNTPPTYGQYRLSHPPAYADSPYYSAEFIHEMSAFLSSGQDDGQGFPISDFKGRWINHTGYERRTVGWLPGASHTIYLFGSSTTLNPEVPDEYTIASYLQRLVGPQYRVANLGAVGQWSKLQLLLLQKFRPKPGDIVIFYDGLADAVIGFKGDGVRRATTLAGQVCNSLSAGMLATLGTVHLYCELVTRSLPLLDQHPPDSMAREYEAVQREALAYCQARGAAFYHFLQPTIWSRTPSAHEQFLIDDYNMLPRGTGAYIGEAWPMLEAATRRVPWSFSLWHAVDALRASGVEVYLDYDHMTERGNEAVARAIFNHLTVY